MSRRDFLKWSSLAFMGLYLPDDYPRAEGDPLMYGRVLENAVTVYSQPDYGGEFVKVVWRDLVLPITAVTVGVEPAHNRVWYEINHEGFVHSGSIQPVEIQTNAVTSEIPAGGILSEVTVPYTEARWKPDASSRLAYRMYYATTHWVLAYVLDEQGQSWYRIFDDKWNLEYYVDARHLRLFRDDELKPFHADIPLEGKRIEVRLAEQVLVAYEGDRAVYMSRVATGARFSNGDFTTPSGRFYTFHKRPFRHMAAGDFAAPNSYDLPGVPWVCYFTPEGISTHGTYWHNDFGKPRSHGCVNLTTEAARWIYLWTQPQVMPSDQFAYKDFGTTVDIF